MDWSKLDAGLIAALGPAAGAEGGAAGGGRGQGGRAVRGERGERAARGERTLSVFVHVDPAGADADSDRCDRLGLGGAAAGQAVRTATLSPAEVAELSDLPWVSRLTLAGRLRLLDDDQE